MQFETGYTKHQAIHYIVTTPDAVILSQFNTLAAFVDDFHERQRQYHARQKRRNYALATRIRGERA